MQYVDVFALINLFLIISYCRSLTTNGYAASEHGKRRGLAASATASDRGNPGSVYSCARSEIRWQNCCSLFINIIY